MPAARAASIARWGAFSRTIRPHQTACSPPGPSGHALVSTPLATTCGTSAAPRHRPAVARETAASTGAAPRRARSADSSHGVGGVWRVRSTGTGSSGASVTGR
jgi:hypothetical protein